MLLLSFLLYLYIDPAFTDLFRFNYTLSIFENDISDHNLLLLDIGKISNIQAELNRQYKHVDYVAIKNDLDAMQLEAGIDYHDLSQKITSTVDLATRIVTRRKKDTMIKPYVDEQLLREIKEKNKLYRLSLKFPNSSIIKSEYFCKKGEVAAKILARKKHYYTNVIKDSVGNPKKLWSVVNCLLYNRQTVAKSTMPEFNIINGCKVYDEKIVLDGLNERFTTMNNFLIPDNLDGYAVINETERCFTFDPADEIEIRETIMSLKKNSSPGYDGIATKII